MSSANPLLLPENLSKYGLGIWTSYTRQLEAEAKSDTEKAPAPQPLHYKIHDFVCDSLDLAVFAAQMEPLEKVFKNVQRGIEIAMQLARTANEALSGISANFKSAAEFLESIRFIGAWKQLLIPQKNNKYLLTDPDVSSYKKGDRVLLAGHTSCKMVRALNKWKLIDLGQIAKVTIGAHLTVFHFITDGLMIGSSSLGLLDLSSQWKNYVDKLHQIDQKRNKWKQRNEMLGLLLTEDQSEITKFQKQCEQKVEKVRLQLELKHKELNVCRDLLHNKAELSNEHKDQKHLMLESKKNEQQIGQLETKLNKNVTRLQKLAACEYTLLVHEMSSKNVKNKQRGLDIQTADTHSKALPLVIKTASSAAKIAVISFALVLTAFNFFATLPTIALLSLGIIADSLGLVKIFMEKNRKAE